MQTVNEHCQPFTDRETLIDEPLQSLTDLRLSVVEFPQMSNAVSQLASFLESLKDPINSDDTIPRHERLKPLRDMLFWFPS